MAPSETAKTVAVAAGAAAAAALAYSHLSKRSGGAPRPLTSRAHISTVIFADAGDGAALGRTVRHPRGAPVGDLLAAAGAAFNIDNPRCGRRAGGRAGDGLGGHAVAAGSMQRAQTFARPARQLPSAAAIRPEPHHAPPPPPQTGCSWSRRARSCCRRPRASPHCRPRRRAAS
jgi:hypothetical protein